MPCWGQTRIASCLRLLLTAARRDLLPSMDETPQSRAPVTQVRVSGLGSKIHTPHNTPNKRLILSFNPPSLNPEPSTSRASLNFHEYGLSRPPLSRSHLHFSTLDASSPTPMGASSSLFSQPSTSSAPGPFSTGFSLVKEIKDNLSQHEDDNISTTSGFSSRASDKGKSRALECPITM